MTQTDRKDKVKLTDVAERAGVSSAAVSLALRGKPGVAEDTRRRVLELATEMGYQGRGTASTSAGTVGILVKSRPIDVGSTNAFYGPVIAGIMEACDSVGFDVRIDSLKVDEHYNPVEVPRLMAADTIDGLLVLGAYLTSTSVDLIGHKPVVLVDGYAEDPSKLPNIVSDNAGASARLTRHVIDAGHQSIAFVGVTDDTFPSIRERLEGFRTATTEAGLDAKFVHAPHDDPMRCGDATEEFLTANRDVTALVCANDDVALEIHARLGDRVPDDISLTGFDDIEASRLVRPGLTSVTIDKQAMGRLAVGLLRHRIANPTDPSFTAIQQTSIVERSSVAQLSR